MELWIRSQDKNSLQRVFNIRINGLDIMYSNGVLGTYHSRERALEVLDEIQKYIADSFSRQEVEQFFGGIGTIRKSRAVYEMPKE